MLYTTTKQLSELEPDMKGFLALLRNLGQTKPTETPVPMPTVLAVMGLYPTLSLIQAAHIPRWQETKATVNGSSLSLAFGASKELASQLLRAALTEGMPTTPARRALQYADWGLVYDTAYWAARAVAERAPTPFAGGLALQTAHGDLHNTLSKFLTEYTPKEIPHA